MTAQPTNQFRPHDSRSPRCSCIEDAESAKQQIMRIYETWFDAILIMARQVNEFSSRYAACQEKHDTFHGDMTLVDIYTRLLDLLEAAVSRYKTPPPSLPSLKSPFPPHGRAIPFHEEADMTTRKSSGSSSLPGSRNLQIPSISPSSVGSESICMSVPMTLGDYQLDENQSSVVALEVLSRVLANIVTSLKGIQRIETSRFDELANRAFRLLGICSVSLTILS